MKDTNKKIVVYSLRFLNLVNFLGSPEILRKGRGKLKEVNWIGR